MYFEKSLNIKRKRDENEVQVMKAPISMGIKKMLKLREEKLKRCNNRLLTHILWLRRRALPCPTLNHECLKLELLWVGGSLDNSYKWVKLSLLFLMETRAKNCKVAELKRKLLFGHMHCIDPNGLSSRLCLL